MSTLEKEPSDEELVAWLQAEIHPEATIHGIAPWGDSDHLWYYLACWTRPHKDDATLQHLCLRYIQWPKASAHDDMEPTFKTNGAALRERIDRADKPDGARTKALRLLARAQTDAKNGGESGEPLILG